MMLELRLINSKFDEIVAFSGTEKFLDTPLKHYSSGMQLRLAFSVAAFLESEILIIDEVLAVGDVEFQKKCLGKMEDVTRNGRTILFVSHNLQALLSLCKTGIYLAEGKLKLHDDIQNTVRCYLDQNNASNSRNFDGGSIKTDPEFKMLNIRFEQAAKEVFGRIVNGDILHVEIHYELLNSLTGFRVFLDLCDQFGSIILRSFHDEDEKRRPMMEKGRYVSRITIPANFLAPIAYDFKFSFGIHNLRMLEPMEGISYRINVEPTGAYNKSYDGQYTEGQISPILQWEIIDSI